MTQPQPEDIEKLIDDYIQLKDMLAKAGDALSVYMSSESVQKAFTPDWRAKGPKDERDIDKYAEARKRKEENRIFGIKEFGGQRQPLVKTWMES